MLFYDITIQKSIQILNCLLQFAMITQILALFLTINIPDQFFVAKLYPRTAQIIPGADGGIGAEMSGKHPLMGRMAGKP